MPSLAFASPILPGQAEAWRRFTQELLGSRRAEYAASRRRLGIRRELIWCARTGQGELAVVYLEAEDPAQVLPKLAASTLPFDGWLKQRLLELHGLDLAEPRTLSTCELVSAWEAPGEQAL